MTKGIKSPCGYASGSLQLASLRFLNFPAVSFMMAQAPAVKVGRVDVLMRQLKEPEVGQDGYDGPDHHVKVLPTGHRRSPSSKAFEVDVIWEKDVDIRLRDNTILKGDVFRPAHSGSVPAIIPWSPYGKTGRGA